MICGMLSDPPATRNEFCRVQWQYWRSCTPLTTEYGPLVKCVTYFKEYSFVYGTMVENYR